MIKMTINIFCFLTTFLAAGIAHGQSIERTVIATGGDYFQSPTHSLSWTIGEPITETFSNTYMTLTQGFQQSDKITLTSVKDPLAAQYDIKVFPNPTADVLNITINNDRDEIVIVQIYNMGGARVLSEKILDKNIRLNLSELMSANYLLSLHKLNGELITSYVINKSK